MLPELDIAYQVSYSLLDEATCQREVDGLIKLNNVHPLKQMYIITKDEERTIIHESGATIEVIPIWKWLLY